MSAVIVARSLRNVSIWSATSKADCRNPDGNETPPTDALAAVRRLVAAVFAAAIAPGSPGSAGAPSIV
jgi:hypothetical protein